ncbi:recombinase family protein [Bacillus mycoides]
MIFGYARVSTKKQSLDMQLDEFNRYGCEKIVTEKESGAKKDRKELQLLLSKLRKGDTLVVYKLDRIGRTIHQLVNLLQEFNNKSIHFVSIKDGLDTSTTMGRFLFHIFGAMAEMEREVIN